MFTPGASVVGSVSAVTKYFRIKNNPIVIDNVVFRMHYRLTTLMLCIACILVSLTSLVGDKIKCLHDKELFIPSIPERVMNQFCFFMTTFTVVEHYNDTLLKDGLVAHPGVGPISNKNNQPIIRHNYYQWVPYVLFFQALCFYTPHMIWKKLEGCRLRNLVQGTEMLALALENHEISYEDPTKKRRTIPSKERRREVLDKIKIAFLDRMFINENWAIYLIFCEFLNLFQLLFQIYLTQLFLGYQFLNLGFEVVEKGLEGDVNILNIVFPKVTKCTFYKFGPSGSMNIHDAICVMAMNVINEKIYILLWFWFIILFAFTVLALLWRLITIIFHARSTYFNKLVYSMTCPGKSNPWESFLKVTKKNSYADWVLLYYISKNMDSYVFRKLMKKIAKELDAREEQAKKFTEEIPLINFGADPQTSRKRN